MKQYDIYVHENGREKQVSTTFSLEGAKQMMQEYCESHPKAKLDALTVIGPDGQYDAYDLFDIRDIDGKKILISSTDIHASTDMESDLYTYYDVYMIGEDDGAIEAFAIEYDIPVDEMIAEQEELCESYGTLAGFGIAKDEYYDVLAEDGEEFVTVVRDYDGNLIFGIFVGNGLCPPSLRLLDDIESSTTTTYQNRKNPNKYIEVKEYDKDKDRHKYSRQYMQWETDNGTVKNYTGAKDAKRGRYSRVSNPTLETQLEDYDEIETGCSINCSFTAEQAKLARAACEAIWDFQDSCVGDPALSADLSGDDIQLMDAARELFYEIYHNSVIE